MWLIIPLMFGIFAFTAIAPSRVAAAHLRCWQRIGVHPAEPDGFQLGMYRIVGVLGVMFVVAIIVVKIVSE